MAEETLVIKEPLTNEMIELGAQLVQKLDEMQVPIPVAMWLFDSEINAWHLILGSPQLATIGPLGVYGQIRRALETLGVSRQTLSLQMIRALAMNHWLVKKLSATVPTGPGLFRIRFTKDIMAGHIVDDALIYRSAA